MTARDHSSPTATTWTPTSCAGAALDRLTAVVADKRVMVPTRGPIAGRTWSSSASWWRPGSAGPSSSRHYPLERVVAKAAPVTWKPGQKTGSVVLTVGGPHHLIQ